MEQRHKKIYERTSVLKILNVIDAYIVKINILCPSLFSHLRRSSPRVCNKVLPRLSTRCNVLHVFIRGKNAYIPQHNMVYIYHLYINYIVLTYTIQNVIYIQNDQTKNQCHHYHHLHHSFSHFHHLLLPPSLPHLLV